MHVGHFSTFNNRSEKWRKVKLLVKVPDHVPFEGIQEWLHGDDVDRGLSAEELWELVQQQYPLVAKNVIVKGEVIPHTSRYGEVFKSPDFTSMDEDEILGYFHADGTPYDTTPLQSGRLSRLLDT